MAISNSGDEAEKRNPSNIATENECYMIQLPWGAVRQN